jgi:hypothetical protein
MCQAHYHLVQESNNEGQQQQQQQQQQQHHIDCNTGYHSGAS